MDIKQMILRVINDVHSNDLQEADHDTTHVLAHVKYPEPVYLKTMLLKGCLKKAINLGPKLRNKAIKPVKGAMDDLIIALRESEHKVVDNDKKS